MQSDAMKSGSDLVYRMTPIGLQSRKGRCLRGMLVTVMLMLWVGAPKTRGEVGETYITAWRGGASGSYCLTFDDGMDGQWQYAVPILNNKGIKATFFLNGAAVDAWYSPNHLKYIHVPQMLRIAAAGHEIASHTYNHLNLPTLDDADVHAQMALDLEYFNHHGFRPYSFAYPFAASDPRVRQIVGQYMEFARGGYPMVTNSNSWDELDPHDLRWSSRADDHYECVDLAIATGTWAIGVFHKIGQESHQNEPSVEEFSAFVDYVTACRDAGDLWVDTFGQIGSYIRERYLATVVERYDAEARVIHIYLKVGLGYPYIVPLTLRTKINGYGIKAIHYNVLPIEHRVMEDGLHRVVQYDAIPDAGEIRIELMEPSS